jgi:aryl-alcohol dehydrogenase-like predicted oxidoreductase
LKVSEIGRGAMTFAGRSNEAKSHQTLDDATDRGVTSIDTADAYPILPDPETAGRTEEVIGRWLEKEGGRDRFVIATRCPLEVGHGPNDRGLSRRHILAACEASLRHLKVDPIDLDHSHRPDSETCIDETLRAFDDLVRTGKVRSAGCSNYAT